MSQQQSQARSLLGDRNREARETFRPLSQALMAVLSFDPHQNENAANKDDSWREALSLNLHSRFEDQIYQSRAAPATPDSDIGHADLEAALRRSLDEAKPVLVIGERGSGKTTLLRHVLASLQDDNPDDAQNHEISSRSYHYINANAIADGEIAQEVVANRIVSEVRSLIDRASDGSGLTKFVAYLLRRNAAGGSLRNYSPGVFGESIAAWTAAAYRIVNSPEFTPLFETYYHQTSPIERLSDVLSFLTDDCQHTPCIIVDNLDIWPDRTQVAVASTLRQCYEAGSGPIGLALAVRGENVQPIDEELKDALKIRRLDLSTIPVVNTEEFLQRIVLARLRFLSHSTEVLAAVASEMSTKRASKYLQSERPGLLDETKSLSTTEIVHTFVSIVERDIAQIFLTDLFESQNGSIRWACRAMLNVFHGLLWGETRMLRLEDLIREKSKNRQTHIFRTMVLRSATFFDLNGDVRSAPNRVFLYDPPRPSPIPQPRMAILDYLLVRLARKPDLRLSSVTRPRPRPLLGVEDRLRSADYEQLRRVFEDWGCSRSEIARILVSLGRQPEGLDAALVRTFDHEGRELNSQHDILTDASRVVLLDAGDLYASFLARQTEYIFWNAMNIALESSWREPQLERVFNGFDSVSDAIESEGAIAVVASRFLRLAVFPDLIELLGGPELGSAAITIESMIGRKSHGRVEGLPRKDYSEELDKFEHFAWSFGANPSGIRAIDSVFDHLRRVPLKKDPYAELVSLERHRMSTVHRQAAAISRVLQAVDYSL